MATTVPFALTKPTNGSTGWGSAVSANFETLDDRVGDLGVNVKAVSYGAVGNGSTNDYAAVQAAIDAVVAAGGGNVYFPPGKYLLGSTLNIGGTGMGFVHGVSLVGAGFSKDNSSNASILIGNGSASYGPILKIHNAHTIRVSGLGFYGANKATSCVLLEYDSTDTSPPSDPVEHVDFQACSFMGARTYNVQIGGTSGITASGDVSLVSFLNCFFRPDPANVAATTAHVYQRSPNALSNSFHGCQFYGTNVYPANAVYMASGSMSFFGCQTVLLGEVDFKMITPSGDVPPNVAIYGHEAQSKNFLKYDSTGSTANAIRPTIISGVSHSDIWGGGTYTIDWTHDGVGVSGAWGPLVLESISAQYTIVLNLSSGIHPAVFVSGVSFQSGIDFTGTGAANVTGHWRSGATQKGQELGKFTAVGGLGVGAASTITSGTGTPESAVTAPPGSLFMRTDGGASTSLYVKTSGSGNTGWTAK